jgi:hypothetical protein
MKKPKYKKRRNYEHKEKPEKIYKRMGRDHVDVLQNIEFSIVSASRRHEGKLMCKVNIHFIYENFDLT